MEKHNVLEWCIPPKTAKPISSKFVYKRRSGKPAKARMVARGFEQVFGLDYFHSSSPVASATASRLLVATALTENMDVTQGDVDDAYLNAQLSEDLDEPLYMYPPSGFEDPTGQGRAFLLKKSIYGLKNAGYCWFKTLSKVMRELGYTPLDASECFWLYSDGTRKALAAFHVDDWVHGWTHKELDDKLVQTFTERWGVSGVGPLRFHLGMEVNFQKGKSADIMQRTYFQKVLARFGYSKMSSVDTPMDSTLKIFARGAGG